MKRRGFFGALAGVLAAPAALAVAKAIPEQTELLPPKDAEEATKMLGDDDLYTTCCSCSMYSAPAPAFHHNRVSRKKVIIG